MSQFTRVFFSKRMLVVFAMGFASGLPLLLVGSTLKAWCTDAGYSLALIGSMSLVGIPYTFKFFIAPLFDRVVPPFLGRRRGWLLILQIGLILSLLALAITDPRKSFIAVAGAAFSVALFSALQDVIIDAYRVEILDRAEFALGQSLYVTSYRLAMIFASGFALFLADHVPWSVVYMVMAATMLVGVATTFWCNEPAIEIAPRTWRDATIGPLVEFLKRTGIWWALAFFILYKLGDNLASEMSIPFFLKIGYSKTIIGIAGKTNGLAATILGGIVGGALLLRMSLKRSLVLFGVLQMISTFCIAAIAVTGPNIPALFGIVAFETFCQGLGTAAYGTYMASIVNRKYTATQYAILTSLMGVPRVIFASMTGVMAAYLGWEMFFITCGLVAIPGLLLITMIDKTVNVEEEPIGAAVAVAVDAN